MSTATATAAAKQSIETELTADDVCREVQVLLSDLTSAEQKKVTSLLQPLPLVSSDEKEQELANRQRKLFALLLTACSGDDEWILEVFQASKSCNSAPLSIFLRFFLLSESCCRRHMRRYLSFCCTDLDTPDVFRALMTGVYSASFAPGMRTELLYVFQVREYLRRDTLFATPFFT